MAGRVARWLKATLGAAPLLLLGVSGDALTRDDEALGFERTPPRLSYADGDVAFLRAGNDETTPAQINTPLAPGDLLFAGDGANLEIQIGTRAFARGAENTEIGLTNLEPDFLQLRVTSGTVALDLRTLTPGQTLEIDTPNAAFKIENAGYYRLEVGDELTAFTSRRGGLANATVATGETVGIGANELLTIQGTLTPQLQTNAAPEFDSWDRWNYARSEPPQKAVSANYVPSDVYGADELDQYGDWKVEPTYGPVWYPRGVGTSWVPYSSGSWLHDPYYGWSWVDTAPWGWAPFHYGRWVYTSGFWGWCPGPRVARAYYAPALVAFYGSPVVSVVSYPSTLGWVALGYGEPLYPWWGPAYFRAQPYWAGWGGHHGHGHWDHDDHHDNDHHNGGGHGHGDHDDDHGHGGGHGGHDGGWGDHDDHHDGGGHHGGGDGHDWGKGDGHDGKDGGKDWGRGDRGDWDKNRGGDRHDYQNARVKGAIVTADRERFGRRSERASYRRGDGDQLSPLRGDDRALPERANRRADARDTQGRDMQGRNAQGRSRRAERDVVVARREPSSEARRGDSRRTSPAARSFAPGARDSRPDAPEVSRRENVRRDDRRDDRRENAAARPGSPARGERARPPSPPRGDQTVRTNPQGPAGDARAETRGRDRGRERGDRSMDRGAPRGAERPRAERAPAPRVERSEPRMQRAPEQQRMQRAPDRPTARADRPDMTPRGQEMGRGDGGGRSQGDPGGRSHGNGGGGNRGDGGGGHHGDGGGGGRGDGGGRGGGRGGR